ncbi:MAG: MgtC/SapB family protein [Deltaproteobacteria bacterium]|nr:MgtC/SapB family protein [Deltaproteobacteria bacterium]MBW2050768.1 MgtC/SapB family protein [Deltaproteobacteria bacterium]MBW2141366.1 MgtC/SapB family protein [Deltaproteobacteria bacterium]MBW2321972.1 MgtC/SapB family protein [Deltaproteobacteria bacterium]
MTIELVLFRLTVAAALGLIIGYEREVRGRPAGLRTNIVVTLSSCLLMILSLELASLFDNFDQESIIRADPGRIASYAVAGIGFLGAGAIIKGQGAVRGLTTAASLWASNAVGLAVGAGFILPAVLTAGLILLTLLPMRWVTRYVPKGLDIRIVLDFNSCADKMPEIRTLFSNFKIEIEDFDFDCRYSHQSSSYEVRIHLKYSQSWAEVLTALRQLEGLTRIRWNEGYLA